MMDRNVRENLDGWRGGKVGNVRSYRLVGSGKGRARVKGVDGSCRG